MLMIALAMAASVPSAEFRPGPLPEKWKQFIRGELDTQLKDGASARYRWPTVQAPLNPGAKAIVYCGWLNAKNSFGAYNGWRPFYVVIGDDGTATVKAEPMDRDPVLTDVLCTASGYDWKTPPSE